jgi:lipooligosaccharide transport system ATP-binding protein
VAESLVRARGLTKHFDGFTAVDGIDFDVGRGECFGFLGPNGAGKTSTVRMIYGYSPVSAGLLEVFGLDVRTGLRQIKARIVVCQQENNLDPDFSVLKNLLVYARYFGVPEAEAARRAEELLEFVALGPRRHARIPELSGGLQRRLVVARALINNPDLLILDEPTTGLDPQSRHQVWERLDELKGRGLSILLTTHYMDEAARLCDRLVIMDHGKILVEGSPRALIAEHIGAEVIEVAEPEEALEELVRSRGLRHDRLAKRLLIYAADGERLFREVADRCPEGCLLRQASLEDVFLKLTGRGLRE